MGILIDKIVKVITTDGKSYTGNLVGINENTLSLCLAEAKDDKKKDDDVIDAEYEVKE